MSSWSREVRVMRRGAESDELRAERRRKVTRSFNRWFRGLYCHLIIGNDGEVLGHTRVPGGRGWIHNGRKPKN